MKSALLIILILIIAIPISSEENLIPRRIFFQVDPDFPAMIAEILYTRLTEFQPIVAVDDTNLQHNSIVITREDDNVLFILTEEDIPADTRSYPKSILTSYEALSEFCGETARQWSGFLTMVPPVLDEELIDERNRINEEIDLELQLAKDFQITLWLPVNIHLDFNQSNGENIAGTLTYFWPLGAEFNWFMKENVGLTGSFIYEYSPGDTENINRFVPGVGFIFRTLGRVSAEFGVRLDLYLSHITNSTASSWNIYPILEIAPAISWNITKSFSVKALIFGYGLDFTSMFGEGHGDDRNRLTLLQLGATYRW